ncbi:MAG: CNNM domain-containing protein [Planctomycetota bacterium]|nr:CNNM domain-containing protein [Planctomycetota bacterium]MDI6787870.1 CNNM domain-containing protein [Planctomycetota bacterium]
MELFHILPPFSVSVIIICLLILSACFSATEIAMFSFRKTKLAMLVKQQNKTAMLIQKTLSEPEKLLGTILIGNNIVNTSASILATALALNFFGEKGIFIAMVVMTFFLIQFCEVMPKVIASQYWEGVSFALARPMKILYYLFYPINLLVSLVTRTILRPFNIKIQRRKPIITKEELKHIVGMSTESGHLQETETFLLLNVFEFTDRLVNEVMIPTDKVAAIEINMPPEKVMDYITERHFTRIPVYEKDINNVIGVLHSKDYFNVIYYKNIIALIDLLRKPFLVSDKMRISELLKEFQKQRLHMAIVRDDENRTVGVITLENILEQIVGEIRDEHK